MNHQNHDFAQIYLYGKAFHRLSILRLGNQTLYQIQFLNVRKALTPEHTILLSISAFKHNQKHGLPFEIAKHQSDDFNQQVLYSFRSLISLFKNAEQIEINDQNKDAFLYLAEKLDNKSLQSICYNVSPTSPQNFFFSSERFSYIYQRTLSQLFDFTVYINNQAFQCNSSFASCFSEKIFQMKLENPTMKEIHFDNMELNFILNSFFQVLNGFSFSLSNYDLNLIQSAIDLVAFYSPYSQITEPNNFQQTVIFLSKPILLILNNYSKHQF
jgi:hypothetical protein